ncbi:MAG: DUF1684 domain-containing protein [Trueperaceae bacterium]|nr:DUF1684 domain-containing protein [Truepera sp.]
MARPDPATALAEWRRQKDEFLARHPSSPIFGESVFSGLSYYPEDPAARVVARVERTPLAARVTLPTSSGDTQQFQEYGVARFELDGQELALTLFAGVHEPEGPRLFVPFTDATAGGETYGGGRYLDPRVEAAEPDRLLLDFNYAYHPYCAYAEGYSCAMPPPSNRLPVPVRAGERLPRPEEP